MSVRLYLKDSFASQKEMGIFPKPRKSVALVYSLHSTAFYTSGQITALTQFPSIPATNRVAEKEVYLRKHSFKGFENVKQHANMRYGF